MAEARGNISMALDLENPEVAAEVEAVREAAIAEATAALTEKYAGLEKNHEDLIADRKAVSAKAKESQDLLERYQEVTRGKDLDDLEHTFNSIEKADYQELLGKEKFDEAYEMRATHERKEFGKQLEKKEAEIEAARQETLSKEERLLELELDNVAVEAFLKAKGRETSIRDLKARIRVDAKRNEEGEFFFPDQFGNPRKDSEGNDLNINTYINEDLRTDAPHFFPEVKGSGAKGSNGSLPPGTKKRSEMTSQEASDYMETHGIETYQKLPA